MPDRHLDGKLVRDRIPELIRAEGGAPDARRLDPDRYVACLLDKLVEEASELRETSARAEQVEELADVYEVLLAVLTALDVSKEEVQAAAERKRQARGAFADRLWLATVQS